jgi:hypothetical protein
MSISDQINSALENVSPVQYQTRLAICKQCPALTALQTCKDCLCIIPIKAKLKSQSCPRNQWK